MRVKKELRADARRERRVQPPASSDSDEEKDRYDVEEILDEEWREGRKWFLIRWVGFAEPSWEPAGNADQCKELVDAFQDTIDNDFNF